MGYNPNTLAHVQRMCNDPSSLQPSNHFDLSKGVSHQPLVKTCTVKCNTRHKEHPFNDLVNSAKRENTRPSTSTPDHPIRVKAEQSKVEIKLFLIYGLGPTCQHELRYFTSWRSTLSLTLSPIHSFANTLSLSTSPEQGRTLELERERNEEKIEGGKEEEEGKHQHLQMDSIKLFNIVMVSSRE